MTVKTTRVTGCTALIAKGYGASLLWEAHEDGSRVQRIICELQPADVPHLQAALEELAKRGPA